MTMKQCVNLLFGQNSSSRHKTNNNNIIIRELRYFYPQLIFVLRLRLKHIFYGKKKESKEESQRTIRFESLV